MTASRRFLFLTCTSLMASAVMLPATAHAQIINPILAVTSASDPPGFGPVVLEANQFVRLNVTCFDHQIGTAPPDPCRGVAMFHDASGNVLKQGSYDLQPGHSGFLQFAAPAADTTSPRFAINPCIIPAPGGVVIPDIEVFDASAQRVIRHINPAAARMSEFNNGPTDPGSIVGFNPQPDPPGFGLITMRVDQAIVLHVACFDHAVNGVPPDPCRGEIMFHNAAGDVIDRGTYALQPGEMKAFTFTPNSADVTGAPFMGIGPCILPQFGGRAVPTVRVVDRDTGHVVLEVNPAVSRMSQFQKR